MPSPWSTYTEVAPDTSRLLVERAHQVCPYSNATRGNIDVRLSVA